MQPFEARAGSSRKFLLGVALALATVFSLVAFLNWWQNPFFAFRQVLPHISERAPGAILGTDRDRQMRWLAHQGRAASANTIVIGASQFLYGMDFCRYPQVDRLALFFLTDSEITQLLQTVVPTRRGQTTFYISRGIAIAGTPAAPLGRLHMLWRDWMGQQTTQASLMNLYSSIMPGPPPCAAVPYTATSNDSLSPQMMNSTLGLLKQHVASQEALEGILRVIEPSCGQFHHNIVILHMPVLYLPDHASEVRELDRRVADPARVSVENFNRRNTGCTAKLRDLAEVFIAANEPKGPPKDQWFDTLHFKPVLGQQFLRWILSSETETTALLGAASGSQLHQH